MQARQIVSVQEHRVIVARVAPAQKPFARRVEASRLHLPLLTLFDRPVTRLMVRPVSGHIVVGVLFDVLMLSLPDIVGQSPVERLREDRAFGYNL